MKKYKVLLLPSAYQDIIQARTWYKQYNHFLPKHFAQQVNNTIECIKINPFAFAIRYKDVRLANMNVFPYAVHYVIEESLSVVTILAIHHASMSPESWQNRLK